MKESLCLYLPGEAVHTVSNPQPSVPVQRVSQQAAGEEAEPDLPSMSAEGLFVALV